MKLVRPFLAALFLIAPLSFVHAALLEGRTLQEVLLDAAFSTVAPGSVLVLGEVHDSEEHHRNQVLVLEELSRRGLKLSVGMEFLERPDQAFTDHFLAGALSEVEFLKAVSWNGFPFDFYREQVLFPAKAGGQAVALNARRTLTGKIAKGGISALTPDERAELPAGFQLGNAFYRERFEAVMGGHVPAAAIQRYFEAQSTWDETMADTAATFILAHPDQILVILVGEFHAAYGGGLPDRLRARGVSHVEVVSQVRADEESFGPHPRYGERGDWVWVEEAATPPGRLLNRLPFPSP